MKVLLAHNYYRYLGGEGLAFQSLADLLRERGLDVCLFTRRSRDMAPGLAAKVRALGGSIYSAGARREMTRLLRAERPDVVHAHNLYPFLSPSIFAACRALGVPSVMTCHNYGMTCPTTLHLSNGRVCEVCFRDGPHMCMVRNCR